MAPNAAGYTVLIMSYSNVDAPDCTWRLMAASSKPLKAWAEQPSTRTEAYEGMQDLHQHLNRSRGVHLAPQSFFDFLTTFVFEPASPVTSMQAARPTCVCVKAISGGSP